jgi:oligosaccharide reducing-end xylanase
LACCPAPAPFGSCSSVATPTVTSPVNYCQKVTATALTATGTALKWYTVATTGTALSAAPVPSTNATGTTTYYVSQTVGGVESSRASIAVNVNALPTISTGSAVAICSGTSTIVTATGGASYKWSNSITSATNTVSPTITTTYSVNGTNTSACSATSSVVVTVNAIPAVPSVTATVNYVQNATATALTATGTSLKWYTISTGGTALTVAPTPTTTVLGTTNYYVSQTTNTCESPRATIAVIVSVPAPKISLKAGWNYIGCPIVGTTTLASALASIWSNVLIVKNLDEFYSTANTPALNTLTSVKCGQGYFVKVSSVCDLDWIAK